MSITAQSAAVHVLAHPVPLCKRHGIDPYLTVLSFLFLQITDLQHSVASPMSFKLEYKRGSTTPAVFQRQVRMLVEIAHVSAAERGPEALYAITFTLLSGKDNF